MNPIQAKNLELKPIRSMGTKEEWNDWHWQLPCD